MNTIFYLDIIEICLLNIPKGETVGQITAATILNQLNQRRWEGRKYLISDVQKALKTIFPIYKNKRLHVNSFKISQHAAEEFLEKHDILLRPVEDARESIFSKT